MTVRSASCCADLPDADAEAAAAVHDRAADILRPSGALALARRARRVGRRLAAHRPAAGRRGRSG